MKLRKFISVVAMTPRRRLAEMALLPTKRISRTPVLVPSSIVYTTSTSPFGSVTRRGVTCASPRPLRL